MSQKWLLRASFLLIVSASFLPSSAQVRITGQISGTVIDPSGSVVPGAVIATTMSSTGFTQSVAADSSGQYVFPELQQGVYQVTATANGFASTAYKNVVVEASRTKDLQIHMTIGQISEHVEVSAQGEILETTTNTLATTIDPDEVQDLPLNGRDILPMAEIVSGAQSGGDERFTTFNSLPNGSISITIDGMTANSQRYRTSTTGFYTFAPLRLGAFDEMTVSTTDLTADAGAEGSMQAQFVMKRGSNQFHGNAFWEARNSFFNANSYTNNALGLPRAFQVLNDWGGSLGGPLWKNKVFFFVNF
jgi:Carboxypeptidase regulatory-like domain